MNDQKKNNGSSDQLEVIAARLAELGHPTRLAIYKLLVKSGESGCLVGDIQKQLDIPGSTLSHHIAKLVKVKLVRQQRESRTLHCFPQFGALIEVIDFLQQECCVNQCR